MIRHRFHVPRAQVASLRRTIDAPRFRERLRLREALGYLAGDREALAGAPPAVVLTRLEVSSNGAAVAHLETLRTNEGRIAESLETHLDPDQYGWRLVRDAYGDVLGFDFELSDLASWRDVLAALRANGIEDAGDVAAILCQQPHQPMVSESLLRRAREAEKREAESRRRAEPLGYDFE